MILLLFILSIIYVKTVRLLSLPKTEFLYIIPFSRIFEFSIGILLGFIIKSINKFELTKTKHKIIFTFLELLVIATLFFSIEFFPSLLSKYCNTVVWIIPNVLILTIFSLEKGYISKFLGNKLFFYLGNLTFNAYIVHKLVYLNVFTIPGINDNMKTSNKFIALLYILFSCFILADLINKIDFNSYFEIFSKIFFRKKKKK